MPARTRWWWTLAVASRLGIGACVWFTPLSLKTRTADPALTALSAFSHSRLRASSIPSATGKRMGSVVEIARSSPRARIFSSSAAVRTGWSIRIRLQCFLVSSKRFCSGPRLILSDMTSSSRSGSIGGLVTCAKCCLKYENRSCGLSESTARGVSVPIEPSGSLPFWAIGASRMRWSSMVYPKARWRSRSVAGSGRGSASGSGSSLKWISPSSSHSLYGFRPNSGLLTSSSCKSSCLSVSTTSILPGWSLQRSITSSAGTLNAPSSDATTIGERDRGRTIPRLHEGAVVLVEGAPIGVHQLVVLPGLGDHHGDRMRQASPGKVQQLQGVVEGGRVALARQDDRRKLLQILPEKVGT